MFCYENLGLFDIVSLIASLIVEPWSLWTTYTCSKNEKKGTDAVLVVCLMSGISMRKKDVKNNLSDNIQNNMSFFYAQATVLKLAWLLIYEIF